MSKVPSKTQIPVAVSSRSNFDFDNQHITTADFMQFNVVKAIELVPNQSINIHHKAFARLEPLVVPTFGRAKIQNKAFFVPYRTIFPGWNDFINDVQHTYSGGQFTEHITNVPYIDNSTFVNTLLLEEYSTQVLQAEEKSDFIILERGGNVNHTSGYKFTPKGRHIYKLLRSLGYGIDFNLLNTDTPHSALPLFAVAKIYLDWYYPQAYTQDWLVSMVEQMLKYDTWTNGSFVDVTKLGYIFDMISKVCYDSDYFTSSWDNPVNPNDGTYSNINIIDVNGTTSSVKTNYYIYDEERTLKDAPVLESTTEGQKTRISDYILTALKSVTDYLSRHRIVGARALDRYLSRWNVKLSSEKLQRSMFIGGSIQPIEFGDVTSTSDTDGAPLGAFAGKGISYGSGNYEFSTDEFGMFLIVSTIVPETSYYQGANRTTLHLSKLDFFTPEFDNLGVQALLTKELYMPTDATKQYKEGLSISSMTNQNTAQMVFSFIPRYAEYKVCHDQLTGDYTLDSMNVGKDSWTLFRDVSSYFTDAGMNGTKHDVNFVRGEDAEQYNRIFYNTNNTADHFNMQHLFNIKTSFPGKSLWDTYEFANEDKAQKTTVDVNGVKAN